MSKTALALRHVHFEDLGAFEAPLTAAGYVLRYCDMGLDDPRASAPPDLLAVLGAPIGAYENDIYPFLDIEMALIGAQLDAGKPLLGVCLGAQLIAKASGAKVYPGRGKEIGWKTLTLTEAGAKILSPFKGVPVLHWHGDTFDLPKDALNLASTDLCDHQAFSIKRNILAFQFHPEAQKRGFERWLIGHAGEIAATRDVSVPRLRQDMEKYADDAAARGQLVLSRWLEQLAA